MAEKIIMWTKACENFPLSFWWILVIAGLAAASVIAEFVPDCSYNPFPTRDPTAATPTQCRRKSFASSGTTLSGTSAPRSVTFARRRSSLTSRWRARRSSSRQGWKKTGFFKIREPAQCVFWFFGFFWVFLYICREERVFRVFSVSRILLGASRL